MGVVATLFGNFVILEFDKEVVASKNVLKSSGAVKRSLVVAFQESLLDDAAQATCCGDQAAAVLLE